MIIIGQNKKIICNYNNVTNISIKENLDSYSIYLHFIDGQRGIIAEFKTKNRCIEILQEIANFYNESENVKVLENLDVLSLLDNKKFVYEIPEV